MDHELLDCAADAIRRSRRIAIPVGDLAARVAAAGIPTGSGALERALRQDPRFRVLVEGTALFPGLERWDPRDVASYAPAFAAAGLAPAAVVVLMDGTVTGTDPLDRLGVLLHRSVASLVDAALDPAVASAAERALAAFSGAR